MSNESRVLKITENKYNTTVIIWPHKNRYNIGKKEFGKRRLWKNLPEMNREEMEVNINEQYLNHPRFTDYIWLLSESVDELK